MSSIAYVSDNKILQFHRINGHGSMNFWRFNTKNFSDFKMGDLLFFLTKERSQQKEKTILGYGRCKEIIKLNVKQTWQKYGKLNGFDSEKEFKRYIEKNTQEKIKYLSCIYLEDVVFFQSPVNLNDLDFKVSHKLVSYTYIDKKDDITAKILKNGHADIWSMTTNNSAESSLKNSKIIHELTTVIEKVGSLSFNETSIKIAKNLLANEFGFEKLKEQGFEYYSFVEDILVLLVPFIYNSKNHHQRLKSLLGHMFLIKYYLNLSDIKVQFKVVSNNKLSNEDKEIIKEVNK